LFASASYTASTRIPAERFNACSTGSAIFAVGRDVDYYVSVAAGAACEEEGAERNNGSHACQPECHFDADVLPR